MNELDLVEQGENFLAHFGVLGMRWGYRKPDSQREESENPLKRVVNNNKRVVNTLVKYGTNHGKRARAAALSPESDESTKFTKEDRNELIGGASLVAGYVVVKAGAKYISNHPELLARASNKIHGVKSIGLGYDVLKMTLKDGVYKLA